MSKVKAMLLNPYHPQGPKGVPAFLSSDHEQQLKDMYQLLDCNLVSSAKVAPGVYAWFDEQGLLRQDFYLEKYGKIAITRMPFSDIVGKVLLTSQKDAPNGMKDIADISPLAALSVINQLEMSFVEKKLEYPDHKIVPIV